LRWAALQLAGILSPKGGRTVRQEEIYGPESRLFSRRGHRRAR
jgi:hypothetical protein